MTFEEKFQEIRKAIPKTKKTFDFDFAIQINMTDEDCQGSFYAAYRGGCLEVEPYDYHDRDALIAADSAVLLDVLKGKETAQAAYERKALLVEGDLRAAKELSKVCRKVRKTASRVMKATKSREKGETKSAVKSEKSRARRTGGALGGTPKAAGVMAKSATKQGSIGS